MKKWSLALVSTLMFFVPQARCQVAPPIKLVQTFEPPPEVKGNFHHFGIDLKGGRLFATPEGYHAVVVLDLKTGKLVHKTDGIGKPHAVLYREGLNRIYITDGHAGDLEDLRRNNIPYGFQRETFGGRGFHRIRPGHKIRVCRQWGARRSSGVLDAERH